MLDEESAEIIYLTKDDVLDLHTFVVERYGGLFGIKSQDRLQMVLQAPRQHLFGTELYPDLCSKAAVFTFLLVKHHPFNSANEATAFLSLLRFLTINRACLRLEVGPDEIAWVFRALSHGDMDREELERWLRENVGTLP
ncbi:type II toxin-antitoxin system death-on-curing family toxin [Chloroflexus sp. Y-396-1]|jgi:death-on-curing protein|uniref:type II toxin-antitoxin system death-on-curing family toxin n=1 Tax=Chloroflexus sp. Y-396-1 TaxID=867845 RepID=UPI00048E8BFB|nr:Fic family protein [Chloroflexus sp. Y-396-1]